jgi:hypothetical protein
MKFVFSGLTETDTFTYLPSSTARDIQDVQLTATWLHVGQRRCPLQITYLVRETSHNARPALGRADDINERRRHPLGGMKLSVLLKFI